MYRDDKEAADALADKLRRDNEELERENEKLRAELAARPAKPEPAKPASAPAPPAPSKKARTKAEKKAAKKARKAAAKRAQGRSAVYNWIVRVACGIPVAALSVPLTGYWLYPLIHNKTSLFAGIVAAVINQLWSVFLIAQPILGWWYAEDEEDGIALITPRGRLIAFSGGIAMIVVTAAFVALVGEHRGDP